MAVNTNGLEKLSVDNAYTIRPRNLTQYTAFRGITDFTNIGQFSQFESGYSFLAVLQTPEFMNVLARNNDNVKALQTSFVHMLEYEFRGLDGLPDMTADTMEITDGNNSQRLINNVTWDTAASVSSSYFEKNGSLINKYSEMYLTGIKDRMSKAKTYHGAIRSGLIEPGPENEIFTLMYYVTDNTMLRLERAVLLCNAQLTKAELSVYNGNKGDYQNKEISIEFNCFPVINENVDKAAKTLLEPITATKVKNDATSAGSMFNFESNHVGKEGYAYLDSSNFKYGIMNTNSRDYLTTLTQALEG